MQSCIKTQELGNNWLKTIGEKVFRSFYFYIWGLVINCKKNPFFNQIIERKNKISIVKKSKKKIVSRQLAPKVFDLNASIYIWKKYILLKSEKLINKKTGLLKMKPERSIDIDDKLDFKIVKYIYEKKLN